MTTKATLQERVAELEREVRDLQDRCGALMVQNLAFHKAANSVAQAHETMRKALWGLPE